MSTNKSLAKFEMAIDREVVFESLNIRHIVLFGETYKFSSGKLDFGSTVQIILPPHGDFDCGCYGCRIYRAVNKINEQFGVRLILEGQSTHSNEMQIVANKAAGIFPIFLSDISTVKSND